MLQSLATQVGAGAVLVVCVYALVMGGWRERFAGAFYLAAYALTFFFGLMSAEDRPLYLLLVDVLCVQAFVVAAWKSPHPWPFWALGCQVACVVAAIIHLAHLGLDDRAYLTFETAAAWGVMFALLLGTIAANTARRAARG